MLGKVEEWKKGAAVGCEDGWKALPAKGHGV